MPKYVLLSDKPNQPPTVLESPKGKKFELQDYYSLLECDFIDIATRMVGNTYYDFIVDDVGLIEHRPATALDHDGHCMLSGSCLITKTDKRGYTRGLTDKDIDNINNNTVFYYKDGQMQYAVLVEY